MMLKSFFRRIADDFRQKELLPLKMLFFVHASTLFVLYPYLTIHMRELGISVEETAVTAAVTPAVAIIMPPLAGILADRVGNFKILLAVASSLGGAAALLLLLVPVGRYTLTYPEEAIFTVGCSGDGGFDMQWAHRLPCTSTGSKSVESDIAIHSCGVVCSDGDAALDAPAYTVRLPPSDTFTFTRPPMGLHGNLTNPAGYSARITPGKHVLHLDDHLATGVRRLAGNKAFLPLPGLFDVSCDEDNGALNCSIRQIPNGHPETLGLAPLQRVFRAKISEMKSEGSDEFSTFSIIGVSGPAGSNLTKTELQRPLVGTADSRNASCIAGPPSIETMAVSAGASKSLGTCEHRCLATAPRKLFCTDSQRTVELNPQLTFWMYLAVRVFVGIIGSTAFAMFEGAVIAILREHKADYGLQRIYASVGSMISSPLSGAMIDYASAGKGYTDFRPAFYLYAALKIISGLLMLTINLEFRAPAHNVVADVMNALRNVEMVALFIACFVLGTAWGYIESFLFWLLQDLGASRSLMGITITVGGIAGIPLLVMSGPIIKKVGHANVLFIGFVFYAIRLLGYSLIYNPWLCLIFEAMESFTSSLATTAAVTYAAALSTSSTDTSIQGLIGGLYYGVGKGSGSLIGGYLMKAVGTRATYRIFAAATGVAGVIYVLFNHFYFRRRGTAPLEITSRAEEKEAEMKKKEKDLEASQLNEQGTQTKSCWCPPPDTINSVIVKNGKNVEQISSPIRANDTISGYGSVNSDSVELNSSQGSHSLRRRQSSDRTASTHSQEPVKGNENPAFEDDESKPVY